MSTVRIQVRRGVAADWTSVNPILAAGEMGYETDTNKFKFGNGTSTWSSLSYAASDTPGVTEIAQDAINAALVVGSGITKTYNDIANTISVDIDSSVVALKSYVDGRTDWLQNKSDETYIAAADRGDINGVASLNSLGKVPSTELDINDTVVNLITSVVSSGRGVTTTFDSEEGTLVLSNAITASDGIVKTNDSSGNGITLALTDTVNVNTKIVTPLAQIDTVEATTVEAENLTVSGNLTVNGTTTTVSSESFTVSDPMIYMGEDNNSNVLDLGIVASFNDGTYQHAGLVRDASDGIWKLFSGVVAEPTTVVDFTTYTKENLEVGGLITDAARIGDTLNAEIQHVHGVTSPIQDQLDAKAGLDYSDDTYATKFSPTFTGTVSMPNQSITGDMIANSTIVANNIGNGEVDFNKIATGTILNVNISDHAAIAQSKIDGLVDGLAAKATKISPTFTGTVVLPADTAIGTVTATELAHLSGVSSSIQTQITNVSSALNDATDGYDAHFLTVDASIGELDTLVEGLGTTTDSLQTQVNDKASSASLTSHANDTTSVHGIADTAELETQTGAQAKADAAQEAAELHADGLASNYDAAGTAAGLLVTHTADTTSVHGIADTSKLVTTDAAEQTISGALTITGNLIIQGTTTTVSATDLEVTDPIIYMGTGNVGNAVDLGFAAHFNDGTYQHTGLVRDASDSKWKFFKGVTDEPSTTINFAQGSLDDVAVNNLTAAGVVFTDGTQTKSGVPSITTIPTALSSSTTISAGEQDKFIPLTGAVTITLPATGYVTGQSIDFYQASGTGAQFASTNSVVGTPGLKFRTTNSVVTAMKISTGWLVFGDLSA